MSFRPLILLAIAAGAAASAQQSRQERAKAFQLESIAPAATPTPGDGPASAAPPAVAVAPLPDNAAVTAGDPAPGTPPAPTSRARFTLDTPIADLIADPAARAVLDRDLPGLSTDENLPKFARLGLRQFQPLTGGQLTDIMLAKVGGDLSSLDGPLLAPLAPVRGTRSKRDRDDSR